MASMGPSSVGPNPAKSPGPLSLSRPVPGHYRLPVVPFTFGSPSSVHARRSDARPVKRGRVGVEAGRAVRHGEATTE